MRVEIFRLTGQPVVIEVEEPGTVRDVFSHPDSGKVLGRDGNLRTAAQELYGSLEQLGTLRVKGSSRRMSCTAPRKGDGNDAQVPGEEGD